MLIELKESLIVFRKLDADVINSDFNKGFVAYDLAFVLFPLFT